MDSTFLSVILGAVVSIAITICVEHSRKPRLVLVLASSLDNVQVTGETVPIRFVGVTLVNKRLPFGMRWLARTTAVSCQGVISFHRLEDARQIGPPMLVRWASSAQPTPPVIQIAGQQGLILDFNVMTRAQQVDVAPGESQRIDIAGRFADHLSTYGWSNQSFFSMPRWRNKQWQLSTGRYLIKVEINSAGQKCSEVFRLENPPVFEQFRLEEAYWEDRFRVGLS